MNYKNILENRLYNNKYLHWYISIINKAASEARIKTSELYYEKHHILPSCVFPEYSNLREHKWNGVLLTPREHFICHYLLCKTVAEQSYIWVKFTRAFTFMWSSNSRHKQRYFNSRLYNLARKNIGTIMSQEQSGDKNSQYGTCWVSNPSTKHCCKIPKGEINTYLNKGYIQRRIVNWDSYQSDYDLIEAKRQNKIQKNNDKIIRQILNLKDQIRKLEKQLVPLPTFEEGT